MNSGSVSPKVLPGELTPIEWYLVKTFILKIPNQQPYLAIIHWFCEVYKCKRVFEVKEPKVMRWLDRVFRMHRAMYRFINHEDDEFFRHFRSDLSSWECSICLSEEFKARCFCVEYYVNNFSDLFDWREEPIEASPHEKKREASYDVHCRIGSGGDRPLQDIDRSLKEHEDKFQKADEFLPFGFVRVPERSMRVIWSQKVPEKTTSEPLRSELSDSEVELEQESESEPEFGSSSELDLYGL